MDIQQAKRQRTGDKEPTALSPPTPQRNDFNESNQYSAEEIRGTTHGGSSPSTGGQYEEAARRPITEFPRVLYYKKDGDPADRARLLPFDPRNIVYSKPQRMDYGGCHVECQYRLVDAEKGLNTLIPITLQSPLMSSRWGLNVHDKAGQRKTISVDLSFYGMEKNPVVLEFHDVLAMWDDLVLEQAKKEKRAWFKGADDIHEDVLKHFFKRITKPSKRASDGKIFSPSLRAKVYKRYNNYECEAYTNEDPPKLCPMESIKEGTELTALIRHTGIWFGDNSFTSAFKLIQAQVSKSEKMVGFGLVGN